MKKIVKELVKGIVLLVVVVGLVLLAEMLVNWLTAITIRWVIGATIMGAIALIMGIRGM